MKVRRIFVKQTTIQEVAKQWESDESSLSRNLRELAFQHPVFITCNAKGDVKWRTAKLYRMEELYKKDIVIVGKA